MNPPQKSVFLLVEDNPDDALLMNRAMMSQGLGIRLHVVAHGQEAMDYLTGNREFANRERYPMPTIVFLDLKMPRVSGFEVLRWIRQTATTRRIVVIILTSSNQPSDISQAYDLGANSYVVKPSTFAELLEFCTVLKSYWLSFNRSAQTS